MTRLGPLLAAGAAAVLVLAACGPGDDPKPNFSSVTPTASGSSASPSPTGSPSPSVPTTGPNVSPGEVPPTEPSTAKANGQSAAISFVGYYVRMSDWVFATSDTDLLTPFFATTCTTCTSGQQYLEGLVKGGAHFEGGRITIDQISVVQNDGRQGADFAITSVTNVRAAKVVASDGSIIKTFPATDGFQLTDWVKFGESGWKIVEERKV